MNRRRKFIYVVVIILVTIIIGSGKVKGISDNEGPIFESLVADKTEVTVGETINFTLKASDISGIPESRSNYLYFKNNSKTISVDLKKTDDNTLTGSYTVKNTDIDGTYTLSHLALVDTYENKTLTSTSLDIEILSKEMYDNVYDILPIENVTIVTSSKTLSNVNIKGDLYIGFNTVVNLKDVIVTGNIYVLGTLRANSISANAIYANNIVFGGIAYGNGRASISGSCSIRSSIAISKILTEIPVRIDSDLIAVDGKLSVRGAYANIATMYIQNKEVNATKQGKFYIKDINVENTDKITIKFVLKNGQNITKEFDIMHGTLDTNGKINVMPILSVSDISVCKGENIDIMAGISAKDYEDGDISNNIAASIKSISTQTIGEYEVEYMVIDSQGAKVSKKRKIIVEEHQWKEKETIKEATCTETGIKEYTCAKCGKIKEEATAALGHNWNEEYTIDKEETCIENGQKSIHCITCDAIKGDSKNEILAKGHKLSKINAKESTCTEDGNIEYYICSDCGKKFSDISGKNEIFEETIKATEHKAITETSTSKVTSKATLSKNGVITTTITTKCTTCEETIRIKTFTTPIYYPKTIKLRTKSYTYDGKAKKPTIVVTDSKGKTIASSNYTVKYSSNKNVGTATAIITFKGNYTGTKKLTYTINPKGTSLNKVTAGKKQFKATWKAQKTQITGYEIQYSTNKNFKSGKKTVNVKKKTTTSNTVKRLKTKKKYYVRIRTYKTVNGKKYYSSWSISKIVTTKK